MSTWLLPEHLADVLPAEARRIEEVRRGLLDLYRSYGYEMVAPPLIEYTESLLSGTGQDLDLQTFKLIDQSTGRTLGVRPDMTPQVTRIDAHLLNRQGVTRLTYCGNVLHTKPRGLLSSREQLQIGAEVYGHAGIEADLEVIELALASLKKVGAQGLRLDLSHMGVLRALLAQDAHAQANAPAIMQALQDKDTASIQALSKGAAPQIAQAFEALTQLYGPAHELQAALKQLPALAQIQQASDQLVRIVAALAQDSQVQVSFDLADLRGYHYHSGVMFNLYCKGLPNAVARGGRYDNVGAAFGRARPATGFSLDLRELVSVLPQAQATAAIRAPFGADKALRALIEQLREQGQIVVQTLPGHEQDHEEFFCDRQIVERGGQWHVEPLPH